MNSASNSKQTKKLRFRKSELIWLAGNTFYGRRGIFEPAFSGVAGETTFGFPTTICRFGTGNSHSRFAVLDGDDDVGDLCSLRHQRVEDAHQPETI